MVIWHISDTHDCHHLLRIPAEGITAGSVDVVIHSGDAANARDPYRNEPEMWRFIEWFAALPLRNKVYVPGNHDSSIEKGLITKQDFADRGIVCLINEGVSIEGKTFWGSPFTPTFGEWSYMRARHKIGALWDTIPDNLDVLITHGPPRGFLDLTYDKQGNPQQVGCGALAHAVRTKKPRLHLFGHVHDCKEHRCNAGTFIRGWGTVYSNGSCVTDGESGKISHEGNFLSL